MWTKFRTLWVYTMMCVRERDTGNLLVPLSLVSNRENWSWKVVFNIKERHVRPLLFAVSSTFTLSPFSFTFLSSSLLSVTLFHPLWHPDGRQWFMLVIMPKTRCCSTGVKYVLHNVCQLSLTHLGPPCFTYLIPLQRVTLRSTFPFFPIMPLSSLRLISLLPRVKITATN